MVSSDQEKYSEAYLGRQNQPYCSWILTKDAWGGAIEVQILAEYFQVEIVVVDTKSGRAAPPSTRHSSDTFCHSRKLYGLW